MTVEAGFYKPSLERKVLVEASKSSSFLLRRSNRLCTARVFPTTGYKSFGILPWHIEESPEQPKSYRTAFLGMELETHDVVSCYSNGGLFIIERDGGGYIASI